jgi:hypothetical protein
LKKPWRLTTDTGVKIDEESLSESYFGTDGSTTGTDGPAKRALAFLLFKMWVMLRLRHRLAQALDCSARSNPEIAPDPKLPTDG